MKAIRDATKLRLIMPALAGLGVVHALVPPHPGPLLAVEALHASLGLTMLYGIIIAIPIAILAGPVLARFVTPGVKLTEPVLSESVVDLSPPPRTVSLFVVLLPIVLIAAGELGKLVPGLAEACRGSLPPPIRCWRCSSPICSPCPCCSVGG
jgi:GntP family gluconate:H+ symporter